MFVNFDKSNTLYYFDVVIFHTPNQLVIAKNTIITDIFIETKNSPYNFGRVWGLVPRKITLRKQII